MSEWMGFGWLDRYFITCRWKVKKKKMKFFVVCILSGLLRHAWCSIGFWGTPRRIQGSLSGKKQPVLFHLQILR